MNKPKVIISKIKAHNGKQYTQYVRRFNNKGVPQWTTNKKTAKRYTVSYAKDKIKGLGVNIRLVSVYV